MCNIKKHLIDSSNCVGSKRSPSHTNSQGKMWKFLMSKKASDMRHQIDFVQLTAI